MMKMDGPSQSLSSIMKHVVLNVDQCRQLHESLLQEKQEEEGKGEEERRSEEGAKQDTHDSITEDRDRPPPLSEDRQGSSREVQLISNSFLREKFEDSPFLDRLLAHASSKPLTGCSFASFCDVLQEVAADCSFRLTFSSSSPLPIRAKEQEQSMNMSMSMSMSASQESDAETKRREARGGKQLGMQAARLLEVKQADYELYRLSILSGLVQSGPPSMRHPSPSSSRRQRAIDEVERQAPTVRPAVHKTRRASFADPNGSFRSSLSGEC
uniref:Uncharacterized protein n=1 Tax=Hanusia phi TaxID=3032 RepID=A0A7S0DXS7_9CRYP